MSPLKGDVFRCSPDSSRKRTRRWPLVIPVPTTPPNCNRPSLSYAPSRSAPIVM
jgi:hypothetical protein